jgi:hypothetical protein
MKDPAARQAFVKELHLLKTDIFMRMVESGMMPLRPGVQRLVGERPALPALLSFSLFTTWAPHCRVPPAWPGRIGVGM